jgi:radical SAM superfamily enzyme YgiQ (UPF0313 family)
MTKSIILISANRLKEPYPVYPLGISYLQSHLEKHLPDFRIHPFDYNLGGHEELALLIKKTAPLYIGISLRNVDDINFYARESFVHHYRSIVDQIRMNSAATIIVGGPGFSIFPKELFDFLQPDFGICGEGENILSELLLTLERKENPADIPRLVHSTNGVTTVNPAVNESCNPRLNMNPEWVQYYWNHSGMLNIQTKRGCPFHCIYCTYPQIEGASIRTLDSELVVENLKKFNTEQGIDYFFFTDSIFNIKNGYNYQLAEAIIKSGLKIKWGAYFNFNRLPEDLLVLLKQSGLTHIEFGTDSLCDQLLEKYRKPFRYEEVLRISNLCNKLNIHYAHFLILGGYGESIETLTQTFENSKNFGRTVFFPLVGMRIYPNTELHALAKAEGKVKPEDDLLIPRYYLADDAPPDRIKQMARATGRRWVFSDEDSSSAIGKLRTKGKKGPLWEFLAT